MNDHHSNATVANRATSAAAHAATTHKTSAPWSPKGMRLALTGSGLLVLAGLILFYSSTRFSQRMHSSQTREVAVEIGAHGCIPANITVAAGPAVFAIHNASERGVEWEILDGVMVLEERENIAPGFTQRLTTELRPGDYAMTCGLLSNPHGNLHVTPSASSAQTAAAPLSDVDFIGPLSEYSVFQGIQLGNLSDALKTLSDAIQAGDLAAARKAYVSAHENFMRIGPVVTLFADLDHRIDAQAVQFDKGEQDPDFRGFERIAYGLFGENETASLTPYVTALATDVTTLTNRVNDVVIQPNQLSTLAARWLERTASAQDVSRRASYVTDSAAQIAGTVEGVKEIYTLLTPALKTQAALSTSISDDLDALQATLAKLKTPDGYVADTAVSAADHAALAKQLSSLATAFQRVNPALGLDTMSSK